MKSIVCHQKQRPLDMITVLSTVVMPLRSPPYHWLEKDERSPCFKSVVMFMFVLLGACSEASIPRTGRVCLRGCPQVCSPKCTH